MYLKNALTNLTIKCNFHVFSSIGEEDREAKEKQLAEEKKEEDEMDPLDAYMQEVQQVF